MVFTRIGDYLGQLIATQVERLEGFCKRLTDAWSWLISKVCLIIDAVRCFIKKVCGVLSSIVKFLVMEVIVGFFWFVVYGSCDLFVFVKHRKLGFLVPVAVCTVTSAIVFGHLAKSKKQKDPKEIIGSPLTSYDISKCHVLALFLGGIDFLALLYAARTSRKTTTLVSRKLNRDIIFLIWTKFWVDATRILIIYTCTALRAAELLSTLHTTLVCIYLLRFSRCSFYFSWKSDLFLCYDHYLLVLSFFLPTGTIFGLSEGKSRDDYTSTWKLTVLVICCAAHSLMWLLYGWMRVLGGLERRRIFFFNIHTWTTKFGGSPALRFYFGMLASSLVAFAVIYHIIYIITQCCTGFSCNPPLVTVWQLFPMTAPAFPSLIKCERKHSDGTIEDVTESPFSSFMFQVCVNLEDPFASLLSVLILRSIRHQERKQWFRDSMLDEPYGVKGTADEAGEADTDQSGVIEIENVDDRMQQELKRFREQEASLRTKWVWNMRASFRDVYGEDDQAIKNAGHPTLHTQICTIC